MLATWVKTLYKLCNSKKEKKGQTFKIGFNNTPLTNTKFCCSLFCGKCSLNGINVSLGRLIDKNTQMSDHKIMPCAVIFGPFKHQHQHHTPCQVFNVIFLLESPVLTLVLLTCLQSKTLEKNHILNWKNQCLTPVPWSAVDPFGFWVLVSVLHTFDAVYLTPLKIIKSAVKFLSWCSKTYFLYFMSIF